VAEFALKSAAALSRKHEDLSLDEGATRAVDLPEQQGFWATDASTIFTM